MIYDSLNLWEKMTVSGHVTPIHKDGDKTYALLLVEISEIDQHIDGDVLLISKESPSRPHRWQADAEVFA